MIQELESVKTEEMTLEMLIQIAENHIIPYNIPESILDRSLKAFEARERYVEICSWHLLYYKWMKPLADWIGRRHCIEIMAGTGALSYGLQQLGVRIMPTDDNSWNMHNNSWTEIKQADCLHAVATYGPIVDIIVCCWPYMDESAYKSLLAMRAVNPDAVMLYIGELKGGCNASANFFDSAIVINDDMIKSINRRTKNWHGIHSRVVLVK